MTGNFHGSPKAPSQYKISTVAALHNSEYGTFNKDGKLVPTGELSDDQQTPDELQSVERTNNRQHFNPDATNMDVSDIATVHEQKPPRRLKSLNKPRQVKPQKNTLLTKKGREFSHPKLPKQPPLS